MNLAAPRVGPLVLAGIVLGIGLGGFFDGILMHQILQWHNMLASVVPATDVVGLKANMVWDGFFHAATWIATVLGVVLLFRAAKKPRIVWNGRTLAGSMLAGWGLFNLVEGLIDHQILGIHHVRPGENELLWDVGFLASGVLFLLAGTRLARSRRRLPMRPSLGRADVPA